MLFKYVHCMNNGNKYIYDEQCQSFGLKKQKDKVYPSLSDISHKKCRKRNRFSKLKNISHTISSKENSILSVIDDPY